MILASNPTCSTNVSFINKTEELEVMEMICSVNYDGNWAPVMKWQQDGGPIITAGVVNSTVPYKSVTSSLTVLVTRNVTGSKFSCTTYFTVDNKPTSSPDNATVATNVPDYTYMWNYTFHINTTQARPTGSLLLYLFYSCYTLRRVCCYKLNYHKA